MPFTVSHVAAVLPGRSLHRLPLAGLAAGAMSPDLEYVLQAGTSRSVSHQPIGILLVDLPMALAALGLAQLAAPGVASLVPARWPRAQAWIRGWRPPWSSPMAALWLVAAIMVGAFSHILVDSFTHGGSWGVRLFPDLNRSLAFAGFFWPLYRWLQYGGSVVGMGMVSLSVLRWFRAVQPPSAVRRTSWIEPGKMLVSAILVGISGMAAIYQVAMTLGMPGLDKDTATVLVLAGVRTGGLLLIGMGLAAKSLSLLGIEQRA